MKLSAEAKAERRLVRNVKRRPLAQMHLLLREHGWEPSYNWGIAVWLWRLPGCPDFILTRKWNKVPSWTEVSGKNHRETTPRIRSVARLRHRLKQLAKK